MLSFQEESFYNTDIILISQEQHMTFLPKEKIERINKHIDFYRIE